MARRAVLGGGSLNPFGGGGVDFGAFNILNPGNEAYLAFVKVETAWNAGKVSNDAYLAALKTYADAQDPSSSDWISTHARLEQTTYQVQRNVLLSQIEDRSKTVADLVAFDKGKLEGLVQDSDEYRQRLDLYRSSEARLVSDEEQKKVDLYQAGKINTTQLRAWYQSVLTGPLVDNNPDLVESLTNRVSELADRVQSEKDNKMLSDFNDGLVTTHDFLAYATAAKARYAAGTTQAQEWDGRIKDARDNASETALLYRYNLSQQYAQLAEFVKSNGKPKGGTSTSTTKRVVLGQDGQWHTIVSTSTKATKPSASEVAAYQKLQIEIADAKRQMAEITKKISSVGGFVSSEATRKFYVKQLSKLAKGSAEWYAVQGKIDNLNDRIHQEQVTAKQGIRITYPSSGGSSGGGSSSTTSHSTAAGGSAPKTATKGGGGYSLDQFMRAIATQESGGRYDARNASTGAYGKYQILPSNWASWAQKAGLPASAPQTPENQEKVAKAAFQRLAQSYGNDWSRVAAAWFAGVAGSADPNHWGPRTVRYVDAIMSHLGTTRAAVSGSAAGGASTGSGSGGAGGGSASPAAAHTTVAVKGKAQQSTGSGPLSTITSVSVAGRKQQTERVVTNSSGFPTNLDGRAFEKFYANYERAFNSGAESFVDTSSGRAVAYFIGDDPAERIDRMRHLDDLRVKLFDTRAVAYQGTASELTAMNARNEAYKDVARHEYEIVDTASKNTSGSLKEHVQTNPLAAGLRVLETTSAAIKSNLAMAQAAYERGDLTGAYALFQMAQDLTDANGAKMQLLATYATAADQRIAGITRATGGITPEEALGGQADQFKADLAKLHSFDTEITSLFDANATKTLTELKSHLQLDADGHPQFDSPGDPHAALVLTPDTYFALTPDGKIKVESRPPVLKNGKPTFEDDKTVTVKVKTGSSWIDAQVAWTVGEVGSFADPNNPGHLLKLQGKVIQTKVDGKWVTYYENPLSPGSKDGWSDKPWVYSTASNGTFKAVPDGAGGATYQFTAGPSTYSFVFDPKTATYALTESRPGGLFQSEVKDQWVAGAGDPNFLSIVTASGFTRDGGGGGSDQPVFGGTQSEYQAWVKSFQPPASATLGKTSDGSRDMSEFYSSPAQRQRDKLYQLNVGREDIPNQSDGSRDIGEFYGESSRSAAATAEIQRRSQNKLLSINQDREGSTSGAGRSRDAAKGNTVVNTGSGQSASERAREAARALLPPQADPEWLVTQRKLTTPPRIAVSGTAAAKNTAPPKKKAVAKTTPKKTTATKTTARRPLPKPAAPPPVRAPLGYGTGALRQS